MLASSDVACRRVGNDANFCTIANNVAHSYTDFFVTSDNFSVGLSFTNCGREEMKCFYEHKSYSDVPLSDEFADLCPEVEALLGVVTA